MNDNYFMQMALKEAIKAYHKGEIPVGAVIVKNNKIIAKGHNLRETRHSVTKHAEIIAIEKACAKLKNWRLIDCCLYVTLLPCPMCAGAINQARISRIVYGTIPEYVEIDLIERILSDKKYGLPVEIVGNIEENECTQLMKQFFIEKRQ